MALPNSKVDELVEWLWEWSEARVWDKVALRDKIDDALNDAYGSGEADERKAIIEWIRRGAAIKATDPPDAAERIMNQNSLWLARGIEAGNHDKGSPALERQLANLRRQTGQEPPSADSSARG